MYKHKFLQLNFVVEVVDIKDGPPPEPNYFDMINKDGDGFLTKEEVDAYFIQMGQTEGAPAELWEQEDKNKDGKISWEEFGGPKGDAPPSSGEPSEGEGEL